MGRAWAWGQAHLVAQEEIRLQRKRPGSIPESGGPQEKEMATHSSILTWRIPWTEEPGTQGHKELDTTDQHFISQESHLAMLFNS